MKIFILLFTSSFLSFCLIAQDKNEKDIKVKQWESKVDSCRNLVGRLANRNFEKQEALLVKFLLDLAESCASKKGGLRDMTNSLLSENLITKTKADKVISEIVAPSDTIVYKLQEVRRKSLALKNKK